MRSAELVGLTPNGKFVIVATETGEELAIAADDRLRAALRGDRPRLGQLEIEMESALTPREIQARIRAGEDVADVARRSGMGQDRVERFAAPVLAERDHIARQAMAATVRRRGETSANRNLRNVVNERLQNRGIEIALIVWDSHRQADGRWMVTATYTSGDAERQAQFAFDPLGRFSVAGNDEAHWILGDSSASKGPQPGRRRPAPGEAEEDDTEPTLDLSDELALVRVVQDATDEEAGLEDSDGDDTDGNANGDGDGSVRGEAGSAAVFLRTPVEDTVPVPELRVVERPWEPAIVINYPVEPGPPEDASDEPGRHDSPTDLDDRLEEEDEFDEERAEESGAETLAESAADSAAAVPTDVKPEVTKPQVTKPQVTKPQVTEPEAEQDVRGEVQGEGTPAAEAEAEVPEVVAPAPEPPKPNRRKRASVPSWDEIMFGGKPK
jgi:hypothetical protein